MVREDEIYLQAIITTSPEIRALIEEIIYRNRSDDTYPQYRLSIWQGDDLPEEEQQDTLETALWRAEHVYGIPRDAWREVTTGAPD